MMFAIVGAVGVLVALLGSFWLVITLAPLIGWWTVLAWALFAILVVAVEAWLFDVVDA